MKKLFISILLILVSFGLGLSYIYTQAKPCSDEVLQKNFLILKGSGASVIAENLKKEGLIKNAFLFKAYTQFSGVSQKIQAGQYKLSSGCSLFEIISEIKKGPAQVWITIPEGLNNEEIADKYLSTLNPSNSESFKDEFLKLSETKEGYLFPDTYLFAWDANPNSIITKMLATFDQKAGEISYQNLIMASLIEEETKTDLERPIVAGILYKRLSAGWPLQVDVALVTYEKLGLPSSPISNPGLMSIKAALNPEESSYWYYIHDSEGIIHYARTLEEHNLNINKYLR